MDRNKQIDKFFAEKLGKCWHDWVHGKGRIQWECAKCGETYFSKPTQPEDFSPTSRAEDRDEVLRWAKGQGWWSKFVIDELDNILLTYPNVLDSMLDFSIMINLYNFMQTEGK